MRPDDGEAVMDAVAEDVVLVLSDSVCALVGVNLLVTE